MILEFIDNYVILAIVLTIISLFLNSWNPPIKKQYQFLILVAFGTTIGFYFLNQSFQCVLYSFVVCGLVFFKDVLSDEFKLIIAAGKEVNKMREEEHRKSD